MKANWKIMAVVLVLLVGIVIGLTSLDKSNTQTTNTNATTLKLLVVDTEGKPVHNAKVTILGGQSFNTDNKGYSPSMEITPVVNWYDNAITEWFCVNVTITKDGYVDTIVVGCVLYAGNARSMTVKVYKNDGSSLPYVSYVESPPSSYMENIFKK